MSLREGSVIIMEDAEGRYAFQLRDKRLDVAYGDWWGLFDGWMEPGEDPEQAIVREVQEELELTLEISRLRYLTRHQDGDIVTHVFVYPAPSVLSSSAPLEGQCLEFLSVPELRQRKVVPRHRAIAEWYEANKPTADAT